MEIKNIDDLILRCEEMLNFYRNKYIDTQDDRDQYYLGYSHGCMDLLKLIKKNSKPIWKNKYERN